MNFDFEVSIVDRTSNENCLKYRARLFKTNDTVSLRLVKISKVNFSNTPIFFVEKM